MSRAWPWAGWGDMCQPRGWGGQASARSLQRQPPAQPCPAALHGPGWCWHGGGVHHPPPDGGMNGCHTCPHRVPIPFAAQDTVVLILPWEAGV